MSKFLWSSIVRVIAFWGIVIGVIYVASLRLPWLDLTLISQAFQGIGNSISAGDGEAAIAIARNQNFVYSLALLIFFSGAGLLVAFLVMHTLTVITSLFFLRRQITSRKNAIQFARDYEIAILPRLLRHRLVGVAWKEFDETLLKGKVETGGPIQNTIRPQSFINYGLIREKLPGLKIIGSISGYFVGVGLLLTFIGIVLALHEAAKGASSSDINVMKNAMFNLLSVASFKFATSIAGLFTSIVFALVSRFLIIGIEGALAKFCEVVEHQLQYTAPQSITAEMNEVGKEQRDHLREISSDRYFSKLADAVGPLLEEAMSRAMQPVTANIASAVEQLKSTSQTGLADMTKDFAAALHGNAGAEMKGLQEALREIQVSLVETHKGLRGGGEDFSRRLSEAAENLNRLVGEAGSRLEGSAEQSRAGLADVVAAFKQTMDAANSRVESELGKAAAGASSKVEDAMGRVLERLEGQVGSLMKGLGDFQASTVEGVEQTRAKLRESQDGLVASMTAASSEAAEAFTTGMADALGRIAAEIDRFQAAMGRGEIALSKQASAIGDATGQTRSVADAFAETAQQVRIAASPLVQTADRMAQATSELNAAVTRTVSSMEAANSASGALSQTLAGHIERLTELWQGYRVQFDKVDQDLAKAISALSDATSAQAERLAGFTRETDKNLGDAVSRLGTFLSEISESTTDLSDSVEKLVTKVRPMAAE
ncbi:anti-phage defense ZorAB system protein ZorA [Mesorhizobium australicum]|uniref:Anti-phage defense ZorAB system protein ZorA n=1 Tax=Mesorhizobium australicum TaxID=536018 RepID=A0ACC6T7K2_9HYPH